MNQLALYLDAGNLDAGHAPGKAQHRRANAGADIEHRLAGRRRDARRQQHRVHRDAVSGSVLAQRHLAA